jgi:hypothetical protein
MLAASGAANAQSMYEINQRQDYSRTASSRALAAGRSPAGEAYRLEQGERHRPGAASRNADGHVSAAERARIDRMDRSAGPRDLPQSHDSQQAWDRGQSWGRTDGRAHNGWNDRDGWGRTAVRTGAQQLGSQQWRLERRIEPCRSP